MPESNYKVPSSHSPYNSDYLPDKQSLKSQQPYNPYESYDNPALMSENDLDYSSNGLMLYLHYLRDFPASGRKFYVRSTLLGNGETMKTDSGNLMVWKSKIIDSNDIVTQNEQGHKLMQDINASKEMFNANTLLAIMDDCTWIKDLHSYLRINLVKNNLVLALELIDVNEFEPFAAASRDINSKDGTIMYGAFDLPLYNVPDFNKPNSDHGPIGYNLIFIIDNPKEKAVKPKATKNNVVMPLLNLKKNKPNLDNSGRQKVPEEELKLPTSKSWNSDTVDKDIDTPFIINMKPQYSPSAFDDKEVFVIYIDSARFLPENTSMTRVTFRAINAVSDQVIAPVEEY